MKRGETSVDTRNRLTVRIPENIWKFAKKQAVYQKMSLNKIIIKALEEYKNNLKKSIDEK